MKRLTGIAVLVVGVGCLVSTSAESQVFQCERPTTCVTCKSQCAGDPAVCTDVKKNAYCSCANNPFPGIACQVWDMCHYTGPSPGCSNPTPSGECPDEGPGFADPGTNTPQIAEEKIQAKQASDEPQGTSSQ
jgi:hypothetical protein